MPPVCTSLFQIPCPLSGRVDLAFSSPSLLGIIQILLHPVPLLWCSIYLENYKHLRVGVCETPLL